MTKLLQRGSFLKGGLLPLLGLPMLPSLPGGSQPVVTVAQYGTANPPGSSVNIPSGVDVAGPWAALPGFAALLNLSVPTAPTVTTSGYYTGVASIQYTGGTDQPGKYVQVSVEADTDNWAAGVNVGPVELHTVPAVANEFVVIPTAFQWWMNAGTKVGYFIKHDVGSDQPFRAVIYLTRWTGVTAGSGTPPPP